MDSPSRLLDEIRLTEERHQTKLAADAIALISSRANRYYDLYQAESGQIVSESTIRKICLKYRLRFLRIGFFKGQVPGEAREKMELLQEQYGIGLDQLHIIAPGEMFSLERREKDPILLAELPDKKFLIIHKWGGELNRFRALAAMPFRNVFTMVFSTSVLAVIFSLLLLNFAPNADIATKEFFFGLAVVWMGCMAYCIFLSLSQSIFPTTAIWNSRFLD